VHTALPISEPDAFGNLPFLLGSRAAANTPLRERGAIVQAEGNWQSGDTFLLMSDALAASFLKLAQSRSCAALEVLEFHRTPRGFCRWVRSLRAERLLRNDDVSLVWLELPGDAAA
jgi:hypothetical protein